MKGMQSWILIGLTFLTLVVLVKYAYDTNQIAKASVLQTENSQMPFLAVAMRETVQDRQGGWAIGNQGFGPALNIRYSCYDANGAKQMRSTAPLAVGAEYRAAHNDISEALRREREFEIEYESLSGRRYRTVTSQFNTRFFKL
jgi:hypothetical protein